jgi:hypothetical protein
MKLTRFLLLGLFIVISGFFPAAIYSATKTLSETIGPYLDISVKETAGLGTLRPVTGGVPLAEGLAPAGSRFTLLDGRNKPVPCQYEVLATWKDGSIRWVLLDFQSKPAAGVTEKYRLTWAAGAREVQPLQAVHTKQGKNLSVSSGKVQLSTAPNALLRISNRMDLKLVMTNQSGQRCVAVVESAVLETRGKMRSTLLLSGSFRTPGKERVVDFRLRASVYAGLSRFYIEPQVLVNADTGMIQYFRDLSFEFVPLGQVRSISIGGEPGWKAPVSAAPVRLFQVDDQQYRLEGAPGSGSKAPGWMEIDDGKGSVAIALRDFWQQWPKSLGADNESARIGLFPAFEAGTFDHMLPWYKHDYLFLGNLYRLREGQSRRWQIWADLAGNGGELARSANVPLVAAADPVQAIKTGEWGYVAAAGSRGIAEYDRWADTQFEGYCKSIREQRDYGAMNWGDWWGERGCNWGNHEYDTPLHILIQFARTGDPKYFYVGEQCARHLSEVDVVHFVNKELKEYFSQWESPDYPSRPGMVHEHSIGHVGGFHPVEKIKQLYLDLKVDANVQDPYLCLDPFNLGHIFTLGLAHYYLLTGDPWVKETIERIGENLMKLSEDGKYQFKGWDHCGRTNGWSMLALAGEYKISPSDRCLKAMTRIADDALSEQDPNCGGWLYSLPPGHCNCVTKHHVGEAGFISSIRLNGLSYYYRLTGDQRIPDAVFRGINHLTNDTWNELSSDWRYTSCPATELMGQPGVTVMAMVNSISMTHDPRQLRVLKRAWNAKFARLLQVPKSRPGLGKTYGHTMYGSPEAMNLFINEK